MAGEGGGPVDAEEDNRPLIERIGDKVRHDCVLFLSLYLFSVTCLSVCPDREDWGEDTHLAAVFCIRLPLVWLVVLFNSTKSTLTTKW